MISLVNFMLRHPSGCEHAYLVIYLPTPYLLPLNCSVLLLSLVSENKFRIWILRFEIRVSKKARVKCALQAALKYEGMQECMRNSVLPSRSSKKKSRDGKNEDSPRKPGNEVANWGLSITANWGDIPVLAPRTQQLTKRVSLGSSSEMEDVPGVTATLNPWGPRSHA